MLKNKLAFGSWAFIFGSFAKAPWSFSRTLEYVKEAGFDGIEISGFAPHPSPELIATKAEQAKLLQEIHSYGLEIAGFAPDYMQTPPHLAETETYLQSIREDLAFAEQLGIRTLRVDTVGPPERLGYDEYERRFERLVHTWRASAQLAQEAGVQIVWEFEPGFWLNKPSEVKRLVEAVQHPSFRILFDICHAYMSGIVGARHDGEPEILAGGISEYYDMLEPYIGYVHLIDSDGTLHDEETSTHAAFGQGVIDFEAFFARHGQHLAGMEWWGVDFCFNEEVEKWGKAAVPFIRNAWNKRG